MRKVKDKEYYEVGDRVIFSAMGLDGMDNPGEIVGFVGEKDFDPPKRVGQPVIKWSDGKTSACHPMFLWPEEYALKKLAEYEMKRNAI